MSDVIVIVEFVMRVDLLIDQRGDSFIELVGMALAGWELFVRDRITEAEMYPSLRLHDAGEDAVQVFIRLFDIFFAALREIQFTCLEDIARFYLIRNRHRDNIQFTDRAR